VQEEQESWLPFFYRRGFSLHVVIGQCVALKGDLTETRKEALAGLRNKVERFACD